MQAEFSNYIRRETKSYALVMIPIFLTVAILSLLASLSVSDDSKKLELLQVSIICGLPSIPSLIVLCLSYKREALLDLMTPVFSIFSSIMFVIVNVTEICGESSKNMRTQQIYLCCIIYVSFA